jgi:hypothetical protein
MNDPTRPRLTGGPISVSQRTQTLLDCPKCKRSLDITDVRALSPIACPDCENITWAPEYVPRWWYRLRNFVISNLVAFVLGVAGSLLATYIWEQSHSDRVQATPVQNSGGSNVH